MRVPCSPRPEKKAPAGPSLSAPTNKLEKRTKQHTRLHRKTRALLTVKARAQKTSGLAERNRQTMSSRITQIGGGLTDIATSHSASGTSCNGIIGATAATMPGHVMATSAPSNGTANVGGGGGGGVGGTSPTSMSVTSGSSPNGSTGSNNGTGLYPSISAAYWLPAPNPTPYLLPGELFFFGCLYKL